jgi:hypothetical protein
MVVYDKAVTTKSPKWASGRVDTGVEPDRVMSVSQCGCSRGHGGIKARDPSVS